MRLVTDRSIEPFYPLNIFGREESSDGVTWPALRGILSAAFLPGIRREPGTFGPPPPMPDVDAVVTIGRFTATRRVATHLPRFAQST